MTNGIGIAQYGQLRHIVSQGYGTILAEYNKAVQDCKELHNGAKREQDQVPGYFQAEVQRDVLRIVLEGIDATNGWSK